MMTFGQILKLIDAGYSKAEIDAMQAEEQNTEPAAEQPQQLTIEESDLKPETQQQSAPATDPRIDALTDQVNKLLESIKLSNARSQQMPEPEPVDATTILARIIDPTYKKK